MYAALLVQKIRGDFLGLVVRQSNGPFFLELRTSRFIVGRIKNILKTRLRCRLAYELYISNTYREIPFTFVNICRPGRWRVNRMNRQVHHSGDPSTTLPTISSISVREISRVLCRYKIEFEKNDAFLSKYASKSKNKTRWPLVFCFTPIRLEYL